MPEFSMYYVITFLDMTTFSPNSNMTTTDEPPEEEDIAGKTFVRYL